MHSGTIDGTIDALTAVRSLECAKAIDLLLQPRGRGALLKELGAQSLQLGASRRLDALEEGAQ